MKWRRQDCRHCREETSFRVKRISRKPHSKGSSGGLKYTMEHCTKCNKRWYDGRLKEQIVPVQKRKKHIRV